MVCHPCVPSLNHPLLAVLNAIAKVQYDKLCPSMQKIFKLTLTHISGNNEDVAMQAIEFWSAISAPLPANSTLPALSPYLLSLSSFLSFHRSTIAKHEKKLLSDISDAAQNQMPTPSQKPLFFTKSSAQHLLPVLTAVLTKPPPRIVDPDEWTVTMAAGACIQLVATTVRLSDAIASRCRCDPEWSRGAAEEEEGMFMKR